MLSIAAMGAGSAKYYGSLAREDYYSEGGEPPGRYAGSGATALKLSGKVSRQALRNLFAGRSKTGEHELVQLQQDRKHQPGWDLTFSAVKGFSIAWALADDPLRRQLEEVHRRAVHEALSYLEAEAAWTRRGRGGETLERVGLVALLYEHGTSRAQDMLLHTHTLVLNMGVRADGTTGTIRSLDLYQSKMTAGALYRAELARGTRELGFALKKGKDAFELEAIPERVSTWFSKRRAAILEVLAREGSHGPKASELAALSTRERKGHVARDELFGRWRREARELGLERVEPSKTRSLAQLPDLAPCIVKTAETLASKRGHFSERELLRAVAVEVEHEGFGARALRDAVRQHLTRGDNIEGVALDRYSTKSVLKDERDILEHALTSKDDRTLTVSAANLARTERKHNLSFEQHEALHHITFDAGGVKLVSGYAGTGKTRLLRAAREAWEAQGFKVVGAAVAKNAANGLQRESGIQSYSVEDLKRRVARGLTHELKFHAKQLARAAKTRALPARHAARTGRFKGNPLGSRTVLVIDEASMVSTMDLAALVRAAREKGARIVLVGDPNQLGAIDAGGAFAGLSKALGSALLTDIKRQKYSWMREASRHFAEGDARTGVSLYARTGRLRVTDTRAEARTALVDSWFKRRTDDAAQSLILAGTREDVLALNRLAQAKRKESGELGRRSIALNGEKFRVGDRIILRENSDALRLTNGQTGVLERVARGRKGVELVLRLDAAAGERRRRARVPLHLYKDVELGYATTVHVAQGQTRERVFVLGGGQMQDRELWYVQMTRHSHDCRLFMSAADAGEDLAELARSLKRTRAKETALDFEHEKHRRELERTS